MKITGKLLLKPEQFVPSIKGWKIDGIFNPGAIRIGKKIILYVRVAERSPKHETMVKCPIISGVYKITHERVHKNKVEAEEGKMVFLRDNSCRLTNLSHFRKVVLDESGFNVESIGRIPIFTGKPGDGEYGVEDPRLIKIGKRYIMTYVSVSLNEYVSTSLAFSKDLKEWERKGIIFRLQNKDVVIFPEKINGRYVALHRPEGNFSFVKPSIWISYSKDLIYWGEEKTILMPRKNSFDSKRIGSGCPPFKTKEGWLVIYHGVSDSNSKSTYSAGAFLLDLKDPSKVLARSFKKKPLFSPKEEYEINGFMSNVVFPTGLVLDTNPKYLLIYSGGADQYISVKKVSIKDILKSMEYYKDSHHL